MTSTDPHRSSHRPFPLFFCDAMLGSLARWLRMAGFDTAYVQDIADNEIRERVELERRILLTRDTDLSKRCSSILIESVDDREQMAQVFSVYPPDRSRMMTRCTACNGKLNGISREEAKREAPAGVLEVQDEFWECKACQKVYWKGTHYSRILETLESCMGTGLQG